MLSKIKGIALEGLNGYLVEIQSDISAGLPSFEIVGLPDIRVKEAKERVRAAIKNTGIEFPSRKIVVNLAPADKRKEGTFFDLAIAIGILTATHKINNRMMNKMKDTIFIGELSLDGKINKVNGILPMCIEAVKLGIKKVIVPIENCIEAAIIKGLTIIPVRNLEEVLGYLNETIIIQEQSYIDNFKLENNNTYKMDFSEVKGQECAKRALEIASAGLHNCLLIGGPRLWKNYVI